MSNVNILVVEDESVIAMDLKVRLMKLGYNVAGLVFSGEEAVARVIDLQPDLILMDIMLRGGIDGVEAARRIRTMVNIPVIFVTAYSDKHTLQRAKLIDPCGYLTKPFEDANLYTAIELALYKHNTEKRLKEKEQWLAATLKSIGDGVITTDMCGRVTFMNPVAETLTGWSCEAALGEQLDQVFRINDEEEQAAAGFHPAQENSESSPSGPGLLVSRAGDYIPVEKTETAIVDERGRITGNVVTFRNINDRKQAERALRESEVRYRQLALENAVLLEQARHDAETKTRLLQEINHRVKNNLSIILGLIYAEQCQRPAGENVDYQALMEGLANRIRSLSTVHDMLSRSEWMPLRLDELSQEVIFLILQTLPIGKNMLVEVTPSPVRIAPKQAASLALVINEMMTNVVKHALPVNDTIRVKVSIHLMNDEVVVEFHDTGPGYPQRVLTLNQGNSGLYLINNIVRYDLNGQVVFRNEQGAVTTIRFLACSAEEGSPHTTSPEDISVANPAGG